MSDAQTAPNAAWKAKRNEDYEDLLAALKWGASLPLDDEQRAELGPICAKITGEMAIPPWRLREEADKRRAAEKRVAELEEALKAGRQEWVFRRRKRD
jgi:hypothetical protein